MPTYGKLDTSQVFIHGVTAYSRSLSRIFSHTKLLCEEKDRQQVHSKRQAYCRTKSPLILIANTYRIAAGGFSIIFFLVGIAFSIVVRAANDRGDILP